MPEDTLKRLLIKLGISTSDFKVAVNEIKKQLDTVNAKAISDAAKMKATQQEQIKLTKQQISDQQRLTAEAKSMAAVDQAKASWEKKNQEALQTKIKQRVLETTELKKQQVQAENIFKLEQERIKVEQRRYQLQLQQTKETERQLRLQTAGSTTGGGGVFGSIGKFASGLAGGGLIGSIVGGGLLAGGAIGVFDIIAEKIHKLGEALLDASGPAQTLRVEFERLSAHKGIDPTALLTKMREPTRGLVADTELYKVSNNFLRANLKVTSDQMIKLVSDTVNLARAMGKSGPAAAAALERAFLNPTRGMMILARTTGISVEALRRGMIGLPHTMDPATRATIMFNKVLEEEEKMLKRVGIAATTLPELITQLHNTEKNFIDDMAKGVLQGGQFGHTIDELSKKLLALQPRLEKMAEVLGSNLATALRTGADDLKVVVDFLSRLNNEVLLSSKSWGLLIIKLTQYYNNLVAIAENPTAPKKIFQAMADNAELANLQIKQMTEDTKKAIESSYAYVQDMAPVVAQARKDAQASFKKQTGLPARYLEPMSRATGRSGYEADLSDKDKLSGLTPQDIQKIAQAKAQAEEAAAKMAEDLVKAIQEKQREETQRNYEQGLMDLETYTKKRLAIEDAGYQAQKTKLKADYDAHVELWKAKKEVTIDGQTYPTQTAEQSNFAKKAMDDKYQAQSIEAETAHGKREFEITDKLLHDREASYRSYVDAINKTNLQGVQERTSILETEFKQGNVGAQAYIDERKTLIQEELTLTLDGFKAKREAAVNNGVELAKIDADETQARIKASKELTTFELSQDDIRLQALQSHYDKAKKYLETQSAIAKATPGVDEAQREYEINNALLGLTNQFIAKQQQMLDLGGLSANEQNKITQSIAQATQEQAKLNTELAQAKDLSAPLAGLFGQLAGLLGEFRNTQGIVSVFNTIQKSLEQISKFTVYANLSRSQIGKGPRQAVAKTAQQIFDESLGKSTTTVSELGKASDYSAEQVKHLGDAAALIYRQLHSGTSNVPLQSAENAPFDLLEGIPHFQFGGTVQQTGPAIVHKGEEVVQGSLVGRLSTLMGALIKEVSKLTGVISSAANKVNAFGLSKTNWQAAGAPGVSIPLFGMQKTQSDDKQSHVPTAMESLLQPVKNLGESFTNLFKHVTDLNTGAVVPFSTKMQDFTKNLGGWVSGIAGVVQGITGGKNAAGGALSGGMAGMQFGANFGPIGAAVGLAAGAGLGALFGNKEAHLTADLKRIQNSMQSIIDSMNAGTISLSQTIQDLRNERKQAIQMLSGDKKGGKSKKGQPSQIQQAIAAIDQEISKLVDMQTQILQNLSQSLITISQPVQFQEYLTSLDQIIQKYQEFASAAQGNAQEMANANQFLNLSLQNYVTTLKQNLNQAQQTAIQDALTLINLEYQRQQLINQTAQQEYDILTQGVLTRQRTSAMTKGQEIGQLRYQRDMQLQQMDEQIAITKDKVDAETKIFGLASTRIGLEQQLLAAQKEQADFQIAQVLALSQVVQDLTSGLSSGQLMQQLEGMMQGGAMPTGSGLLMLLAELLGLGGNIPGGVQGGQYGGKNWLEQVPQQWQSAAQYVAQQNPNFFTDFEAAAGSPAGSSARSAAESDVRPLIAQGKVEGYDMQGFYDWLQSGTIPTYQSLETGGKVMQTGPILAHEGEQVIPKGVFATFVSSLNSFSTMMTGLITSASSFKLPKFNMTPPESDLSVSDTSTHNNLFDVHSALLGMTQQRSSMEMNVVSARQLQLAMEMDYLDKLNSTISNIHGLSVNSNGSNLEAMFAKVYEQRGRYGSGNFRRVAP
jgi:hypothetical protein